MKSIINKSQKPVVFYDGSCPLCSKEIRHYRRLRGAENLLWLDASDTEIDLEQYGLTLEQAMRRFHVMDRQGHFHKGAYGFVFLWSYIKPYHLLAKLISGLHLIKPLNWFYEKFADWRMRDRCGASCGGMRNN